MITALKILWMIVSGFFKILAAIGEAIFVIILVIAGPVGWILLFLMYSGENDAKIRQLEKDVARLQAEAKRG